MRRLFLLLAAALMLTICATAGAIAFTNGDGVNVHTTGTVLATLADGKVVVQTPGGTLVLPASAVGPSATTPTSTTPTSTTPTSTTPTSTTPTTTTPTSTTPPPPTTPTPTTPCTTTVSSTVAAQAAVNGANPGDTVCLTAGTYAKIGLTADHTSDVTLRAVTGANATVAGADIYGDHIRMSHLYFTAEVRVRPGADHFTAEYNNMRGSWFLAGGVDCQVPNAPTYAGCTTQAAVVDFTLRGNRITYVPKQGAEDAIRLNHMDGVLIEGNEITNFIQGTGNTGDHNDLLQIVYGAKNVVVRKNYTHDNNAQVWFIKDGDASNVRIENNLDVRDKVANLGENALQIFNTSGLVVTGNTLIGGQGNILRNAGAKTTPTAQIDHNVFDTFANGCCSESPYQVANGGSNAIVQATNWTYAASDRKTLPTFTSPSTDDYRATNFAGGVNWRPADQPYGP